MTTTTLKPGERDAKEWTVVGEATVSVSIVVEASSEQEAKQLAAKSMPNEWTCEEVDGEVTIVEVLRGGKEKG